MTSKTRGIPSIQPFPATKSFCCISCSIWQIHSAVRYHCFILDARDKANESKAKVQTSHFSVITIIISSGEAPPTKTNALRSFGTTCDMYIIVSFREEILGISRSCSCYNCTSSLPHVTGCFAVAAWESVPPASVHVLSVELCHWAQLTSLGPNSRSTETWEKNQAV